MKRKQSGAAAEADAIGSISCNQDATGEQQLKQMQADAIGEQQLQAESSS